MGGAYSSERGFPTSAEAESSADRMWKIFGPRSSDSSALRPFESAVVDGFDLNFEAVVDNSVPFANRLRTLMDADRVQTGKAWLLTAAPQCPYPDQNNQEMLSDKVYFDAIWIQFYNNDCGLQSFQDDAGVQNKFNFEVWDSWAKICSKNPSIKLLLGIPASPTAAGSGFVSALELGQIIKFCQQFSTFGGVIMWDASQAFHNADFIPAISGYLTG